MGIKILKGDCLETLKSLDEQSINTCVTSPPYWGLRDYGTGEWVGGNADCLHKSAKKNADKTGGFTGKRIRKIGGSENNKYLKHKKNCPDCGATRKDKQLGLEETPEEFVENLVRVFKEVKRVLRDDGTVWLNLGDSYYNYRPGKGQALSKQSVSNTDQDLPQDCARRGNKIAGLKEKDLVGIPWRVAFALQADGWYLRQDIIWHKPNPMPESVRDRCTKSHEYIFLLSKNPKYYYDNEAIKEDSIYHGKDKRSDKGNIRYEGKRTNNKDTKAQQSFVTINPKKNKRSVWTITTKPYKEAHFATFPTELIEPCVLAGCPEGGTVLDPFGGSGTTGLVASKHNRNAVLCELNEGYIDIAEKRLNDGFDMFSSDGLEII
jgi:DNA modification methylase